MTSISLILVVTLLSILAAIWLPQAQAACDNLCSGHGYCNDNDVCICYQGWGVGLSRDSGDCSERFCPFDISWVDTPNPEGRFHKYLECSGRGICNRELGECSCFEGYEGEACQRSACPNDCSGHGECVYIEDMPVPGAWSDIFPNELHDGEFRVEHDDWDNHKTRGCVCDPHYGDLDCSKRMCPFGTDVLDVQENLLIETKYHTQTIHFVIPNAVADGGDGIINDETMNHGRTFSLTFKSQLNETFTTIPIVLDNAVGGTAYDISRDIQQSLLKLPNRVIDGVKVNCEWTLGVSEDKLVCDIKFTGESVQGKQNLLAVNTQACKNGCSPKITGIWLQTIVTASDPPRIEESVKADGHSFECGRRGRCDYNTGLCECFMGYRGNSCNILTAIV